MIREKYISKERAESPPRPAGPHGRWSGGGFCGVEWTARILKMNVLPPISSKDGLGEMERLSVNSVRT